ncbi:enoyl-CoA hydratase-related protein [Nocardioides houyundeii]|uniref:enoyl-CoA hydratase-related protein n=1 Tax=Nocardioides houyundeii TaxID=2045452 RepID=UPI000DF49503|nr:enoyl-CoA hydratase-related protein [Nocardioides houyundeii]
MTLSPEHGLDLDVEDGVALLTVRNPRKRNALNNEIAARLIEVCDEIDERAEIAALVVRGADGQFCSGAETTHLDKRSSMGATSANFEGGSLMYDAFQRLGAVHVPTIAAVRGAAVGAGLNLALATDLRIMAEDARIIAGFGRARLHPGGGFFSLITRTAGREAGAALTVFNQELSGSRAVELGMAFEALPDREVEDRALELARHAAGDAALNRRTIQSLRTIAGPPAMQWSSAVELERLWQLWSLTRRAEDAT